MTEDIYLDNHATTACASEVLEAMEPYFSSLYGNASSSHNFGIQAEDAIEHARISVAKLIGANSNEIYFTSGATESNNIAVIGTARRHSRTGGIRRRLACSSIEHKSVLEPLTYLTEDGWEHIELPINQVGTISLGQLDDLIDYDTLLISIQAANSEIGTIQPVADISKRAKAKGIIVHCDASQIAGKVHFSTENSEIDLLSLSAHKLHGPKGIGALWVRDGAANFPIDPIIRGGNQESGLRPGTLPVPLIVGFGRAAQLSLDRMNDQYRKLTMLRDYFEGCLQEQLGEKIFINGDRENRLPNNSNITFRDIDADLILAHLPWLNVSTGSACESGSIQPSRVILNLGVPYDIAFGTIRFGFSIYNDKQQVEKVIRGLVDVCDQFGG